jgi:hypothetical protein
MKYFLAHIGRLEGRTGHITTHLYNIQIFNDISNIMDDFYFNFYACTETKDSKKLKLLDIQNHFENSPDASFTLNVKSKNIMFNYYFCIFNENLNIDKFVSDFKLTDFPKDIVTLKSTLRKSKIDNIVEKSSVLNRLFNFLGFR